MVERTPKGMPFEVETPRLILRCPHHTDVALTQIALQESLPELLPYMPWAQSATLILDVPETTDRMRLQYECDEDYSMRIFLKETGEIIGGTGLHRFNWSVPRFEIGYWVATNHTGKGIATECAAALTDLCLNELGAQRVEICCDERNHASAAIARKLDYIYEGTHRNKNRDHFDHLVSLMVFARTP